MDIDNQSARKGRPPRKHEAVERFALEQIREHPRDLARLVAEHFGMSRQAAGAHLRRMVADGVLTTSGRTRSQVHSRLWERRVGDLFDIHSGLEEDRIWRQLVVPALPPMAPNMRGVLGHCVTEMINNAIDHSEGKRLAVSVETSPGWVKVLVADDGVGIFRKVQRALQLPTPTDVILELRKGKVTTAPKAHTGEGIFFTSRLADGFQVMAAPLIWRTGADTTDLIIEDTNQDPGTAIAIEVRTEGARTTEEVFNRFTDDLGFDRTEVPILVATMGSDENLVSRSAARRVVSRLEKFRVVALDFTGVASIGQAFADEIFRVFASNHPDLVIVSLNMSRPVSRMVERATAARRQQEAEVGPQG